MADNHLDPVSPSETASPTGDSPPSQGLINRAPNNASQRCQPMPPGATVYTPTSAPGAELNPRSCVTCRRRKVRCDKHMPCANCRRAQIPCVFPAPERAPRRPRRKDPNALKQQSSEREVELMKRLRKLEGIVEELSGQIELETTRNHSSSGDSPEATSGGLGGNIVMVGNASAGLERAESVSGGSNRSQDSPVMANMRAGSNPGGRLIGGPNTSFGPLAHQPGVDKKFGRLVLNDHGRSRYVSSAFWSKINDELDNLRAETQKISDEESEMEEDEEPLGNDTDKRILPDHHAFIFGYRSCDVDLRSLHPLPSQIPYIWQVYQENVDPMVKILHIPTMNKLIRQIQNSLDSLTPADEALMFAIYYAAVTSLDEEEVKVNFLKDKSQLVAQYRFALEQALAKAEFLTSSEMVALQAFVLFLVLVRRHDDTRFAWTLTGLAIRIAQSIGLHRDGSNFPSLSPFEVEMRRRLWWSLCVVDLRSAEDQGTDLTIVDRTFDTQLPLNINDSDIDPDCTQLPTSREGHTDMTFSLVRYEIGSVARRLHTATSAMAGMCPRDAASTLKDRERMIMDVYDHVENKYLKDSSCEGNPMYWVVANIARVIVAKMTIIIYQPVLFPGPGNEDLSGEIRDTLFSAATEIFEYNHLLNTDPRTRQWRWLIMTYTQWHAVAYLLMEVARRPWSATVERAWAALNSVFTNPKSLEMEKMVDNTAVWLPFKRLYAKARKHREAEIERLKADPQAAIELDKEDRCRPAPATFAAMPGSIKSVISRERWRKLVGEPPLGPLPNPNSQQSRPTHPTAPATSTAPRSEFPSNLHDPTPFMEAVFAQPTFQPTDLFPIAFSQEMANDMARAAAFGFGSADIPRQDDTLALYSGNPSIAATNAAMRQQSGTQHQSSETPLVDAVKKDHPPPWLWPDNGYGAALPLSSVQVDDMDVNMDENFDWQNFGENLRGFELETGGLTGGVWSSHGI